MLMKIITSLLLCFFLLSETLPARGQESTGRAIYSMAILDNERVNDYLTMLGFTVETYKVAEGVRLFLDFDRQGAVFYQDEINAMSGRNQRMINAFTGVPAQISWWQDSTNAYRLSKRSPPFQHEDYIIKYGLLKDETHNGWTIMDESKEIGGYVCYKAIRTNIRYAPQSGEKFIFPIEAWFCPELPFPYGPKQYGGLPGLIMELQDENMHFGLVELSFVEDIERKSIPSLKQLTTQEQTNLIYENRKAFEQNRN